MNNYIIMMDVFDSWYILGSEHSAAVGQVESNQWTMQPFTDQIPDIRYSSNTETSQYFWWTFLKQVPTQLFWTERRMNLKQFYNRYLTFQSIYCVS